MLFPPPAASLCIDRPNTAYKCAPCWDKAAEDSDRDTVRGILSPLPLSAFIVSSHAPPSAIALYWHLTMASKRQEKVLVFKNKAFEPVHLFRVRTHGEELYGQLEHKQRHSLGECALLCSVVELWGARTAADAPRGTDGAGPRDILLARVAPSSYMEPFCELFLRCAGPNSVLGTRRGEEVCWQGARNKNPGRMGRQFLGSRDRRRFGSDTSSQGLVSVCIRSDIHHQPLAPEAGQHRGPRWRVWGLHCAGGGKGPWTPEDQNP